MARVDVVMPQMGESIAEGTLSKWLKKVGDSVKRDEPMFEISTDKVDAEIPSPTTGVLAEVLVKEGQTVPVQTVVARLETDVAAGVAAGASAPAPAAASAAPAMSAAATSGGAGGPPRKESTPTPLPSPILPTRLPPHRRTATAPTRSRSASAPSRRRSCDAWPPTTASS